MMTIYKVTVKCKRERFMESPLYFTEEMNVIADSYDQAISYVRERLVNRGGNQIISSNVESQEVLALFDVRDGDETIIV